MAICHAYTGWPGCTHDAWFLHNSPLFEDGMSVNGIPNKREHNGEFFKTENHQELYRYISIE